ncbi:MAG: carboxypeptidase-like regulatory domain-containing protein [Bdellovibrionales bacterium]
MAALEDSVKSWNVQQVGTRPVIQEIKLNSGASGAAMVEKILRPMVPYEIRMQQWLARIPMGGRIRMPAVQSTAFPAGQMVALQGMTIRQPEPAQPIAISPVQPVTAKIQLPRREWNEGATELSSNQRDRLVAQLSEQNWNTATFAEKAKQLIEKEKGPAPTDQSVRYNGGILVATQVPQPPPAVPPLSTSPQTSLPPTPNNVGSHSEPTPGISWAKPDDGQSVRATLSGTIRLAGGLAVTDPGETLVIFREWEGLAVERAQVWMNDGRFEVSTRSLRGRLLGQLRDARGQILGEGEIKLNQLTPRADTDRIDDLMMTLRPVFAGARVDVISVHSYGQQIQTVKTAKVWMMGESQPMKTDEDRRYFSEEGLKKSSTFVAQASAENHWGTIVVGLTGQESRALLFPNKFMEALLNLTIGSGRQVADRSGVIWGRVTKNGQPVTGARVEMAGDHRQQGHYFNAMLLPDRFADATGENGTFAFVEVTPGIQSVRVIYQGQAWPAQIIPVERNHVSYLDFELGTPESVPLEIFDPLDGSQELNGILRWAGDETSEIEVQGRGRLGVPSGPGLVMLEADAGEKFELMRYTISRNTRRLKLPVVRRDWILSLASRKRVNLDAGVGIAVGFGLPEDFTVHLDRTEDSSATPEIVYFNSQGQAMFTDEGVAGGGFIVFNVPTGLRTVTLASKSDRKLFRQVILSSSDAVNLVLTE